MNAGVPLDYLTKKLDRLGISGEYQLHADLVQRNGQQATHVQVMLTHESSGSNHSHSEAKAAIAHHSEAGHSHSPTPLSGTTSAVNKHLRHLPEIEQMITKADLPPQAEAWSLAIFRRLADAEGAVHGIPPEQVHFHEVGAIDAIVDVVGTCLGFDWLGIDQFFCSALPTGGGTVRAAHGRLPVPVPAVLKLCEMRQVPLYSNGIERELVTPTGAAIATTLAAHFGSPPAMTLQKVGLGAGSLNLSIPNILRLWIGETNAEPESTPRLEPLRATAHYSQAADFKPLAAAQDSVTVLETQIDDLNPQAIGYVFETLFEVGAVDVFTQAIGMKKSRPGILLTVICPLDKVADCERVLFRETSTLGIRSSVQQRSILHRELQHVETDYGTVHIKVAWMDDSAHRTIVNAQPEYEDCAKIARQHHLPWREVHRLALQTWYQQ